MNVLALFTRFMKFQVCVINSSNQQNFRPVQIQSICRRQNNVTQKLKFGLRRVDNIVGKGENARY